MEALGTDELFRRFILFLITVMPVFLGMIGGAWLLKRHFEKKKQAKLAPTSTMPRSSN
jgi:hypothetical protein